MKYYIFANTRPTIPFFFDGGAERTSTFIAKSLSKSLDFIIQLSVYDTGCLDEAIRNADIMKAKYESSVQPYIDHLDLTLSVLFPCLLVRENNFITIAVERREFESVLKQFLECKRPSLLVTMLTGSAIVVDLGNIFGVPTVLRVVGPDTNEGLPDTHSNTTVLANSPTTSQICSVRYARPIPYLYELINHSDYVCDNDGASYVTFVNPRRKKGLDLFVEIARRQLNIPFLLVHGWSRSGYESYESQAIEFISELPNVTQIHSVSDMRDVYQKTKLLLVPSNWPESWARVIGEAQSSSIPVIVSDRGSSSLQVGRGGVTLPYGNPELWSRTISHLCNDQETYDRLQSFIAENLKEFSEKSLFAQYAQFFSQAEAGETPTIQSSPLSRIGFFGELSKSGRTRIMERVVSSHDLIEFEEVDMEFKW